MIDLGAAELAFPKSIFGPMVALHSHEPLTWDLVRLLGASFAPNASLQSVAKATLAHWPRPVFLLRAELRTKKNDPHGERQLRIDVNGRSHTAAKSEIVFFDNMRVAQSSPLMHSFITGTEATDLEDLRRWTTSKGSALPNRKVLTSAVSFQRFAYALVSPQ